MQYSAILWIMNGNDSCKLFWHPISFYSARKHWHTITGVPNPKPEALSVPQRYFAYAVVLDVLVYDVNVIEKQQQCNVKLTDSLSNGH